MAFRSRLGLWLLMCLWALPAQADLRPRAPGKYFVMSGTGFVVSNSGHIVTNAHVVKGCTEVELQGALPQGTAKVVATDEEYDLALLKSPTRTRNIATIRHPDATALKLNEPVLVMGYPLDSYVKGDYKIAESRIIGLKGPEDEPKWIQFKDSIQQGNSGGPLLDSSGNVAGVVVGKNYMYQQYGRNGQRELIQQSDIAIALPILMRFLDRHYVPYRFNGSYSLMMTGRIERIAKNYIVNILCIQPE